MAVGTYLDKEDADATPITETLEFQDEKGLTLEEYMTMKKKASIKKEARRPVETRNANIEHADT
jgi:hypothetical protein